MKKVEIVQLEKKEHQSQIVEHLQSFYKDKAMCDVTLRSGNYSVQAHRVVLAASSDYFWAMFSGRWTEKQDNEIILHDLTPEGLRAVVEFAYHGKITIGCENIGEIVSAIHHCQLVSAYTICEEFIGRNVDESNFYDLLKLSEVYNLKVLLPKLSKFAAKLFMPTFPTKKDCPFFKQLDLFDSSFLKEVFKDWDYMSAGFSKVAVYDLIVTWVERNMKKREHLLSYLLCAVSGEEVNVEDILKFSRTSLKCRKAQAKDAGHRFVSVISEELRSDSYCDNFISYNCNTSTFKQIALFPGVSTNLGQVGLIVLDNALYVIGGTKFKSVGALSCCYKYDPCQDVWDTLQPLPTPRYLCAVVAVEGKLVVLGGCDNMEQLIDKVEVYDPETDSWSEDYAPLPVRSKGHAATVYDGNIYVSGGEVLDDNYLKQFLCYQPDQKTWIEKEQMIVSRSEHTSVVHKDRLYQIDGLHWRDDPYSGGNPLIEYYDFSITSDSPGVWTGIELETDLDHLNVDGGLSVDGFMHFCASRDSNSEDELFEEKVSIVKFETNFRQHSKVFEAKKDYSKSLCCWHSLRFPEFVFKNLPSINLDNKKKSLGTR